MRQFHHLIWVLCYATVFKKVVFHKPSVIIPVTKLFFNRERQEQGDRLGQMEHQ